MKPICLLLLLRLQEQGERHFHLKPGERAKAWRMERAGLLEHNPTASIDIQWRLTDKAWLLLNNLELTLRGYSSDAGKSCVDAVAEALR